MFLDTAICAPDSGGALTAQPSSADVSGVAASLRSEKKVAKYGPLAAGVSSQFRAGVIERFGACCDSLVGFMKAVGDVGTSAHGRLDGPSGGARQRR